MILFKKMAGVLAKLTKRAYWNKVNTIEFLSFSVKLAIIIPGLLLGIQFWWMYLLALITSLFLILTSTVKTLPTIIYFNIGWSILATCAILKHFLA